MKADLHIHSNYSDGSESIAQLISLAEAKGLDAIAVTDHDTLAHLAQVPAGTAIKVTGGIEISAINRKSQKKAHILGYNIQKPETVKALTQPLLEARSRNSERQAEVLIGLGYSIDLGKLRRAGGKYLYKQHIMDWLMTTGQSPDMFGDFYKKMFKNNGACAFDIDYIDVFEAVRTIKDAGGLAVLAHPGQQQNFCLIPGLVQTGLDGLELSHYSNNEKDMETIRGYAGRYGLFLTGGSDYHGYYDRNSFGIGDFLSDESGITAIFTP